MLKGNDKELYDYTMTMMQSITSHYLATDFDKGTDVNKLIEHGVARRIAAIMPDKYTEVEVTVAEVGKNLYVTATYSIDGEAEIVAIHKEELVDAYTYDPRSIDEDFFFGYTAERKIDTGTARGKLDALLSEKVSLGVSCRGTDSKALKIKDYPQYDENGNYDPRCMTEVFECTFGATEGRGSRVETLPGGQGLGELENIFMRASAKSHPGRIYGLGAPTECAPMTEKTPVGSEKVSIDFSTISQLSAPVGDEIPRYETGVHVGIDLAKVHVNDVEQELMTAMSEEIVKEIDDQIMKDIMTAAKAIDEAKIEKPIEWAVPTFGWTEETTTWDAPADITWRTSLGFLPTISASAFGGVITTDNTAPVWYNPMRTAMEEIEFTEADLDELSDLINTSESRVMEFA